MLPYFVHNPVSMASVCYMWSDSPPSRRQIFTVFGVTYFSIALKLLFKFAGSYVCFFPQTDTELPTLVISMI
jgi:hypothetical protein